MTTSTLTKTAAGVLRSLSQQNSLIVTLGSAVDVSTAAYAQAFIKVGRITNTALSNELRFRIEGSSQASGNDEWVPVWEGTTTRGKSAAVTTTVGSNVTAGDTLAVLTTANAMVAGDILYFRETGTPANGEWVRIASINGDSVTPENVFTRSHAAGGAVTTFGELITFTLDLSALKRIRLAVDTAIAPPVQLTDILAWITTLDSVANA